MPLAFSYICDLLQRIDDNLRARSGQRVGAVLVREWFAQHRARISRNDTDTCALLSTLLPERRTDRVYSIQHATLRGIVGRALFLGKSRMAQLTRHDQPGSGVDLADCVEGILKETPNPNPGGVTVEEVDGILHAVAACNRFSSPVVQSSKSQSKASSRTQLEDLYRRLSARDAKWLTRLILKNYTPVVLEEWTVYACCDPLLPHMLKIQDDFQCAINALRVYRRHHGVTNGQLDKADLTTKIRPELGVKIGRQPWLKARSVKHCLGMGHGRMSCEKKYDGEYCQIHIDLSKGHNCIQIFSKSGKDSTKDRAALHGPIRSSLGIGNSSCKFKKGCILEGELVVYSDRDKRILGFDKIRKHVSRSGSFLGIQQDSQPHEYEHLMIVYFDALLIDDESQLGVQHAKRFRRLSDIVHCQTGRAELVECEVIDFSSRQASRRLREAFASCIVERGEGLVLKPNDPYFDFNSDRRRYGPSCIKLKKEYIGQFGDVGDFAVIGARYDAATAKQYQKIPNVRWTHFFIACLLNKEGVRRWGEQPQFKAINVVELNQNTMEAVRYHTDPQPVPYEENDSLSLDIQTGVAQGKMPTEVFMNPLVFDVRCFSFQKQGNTGVWSLRFPMVTKVHSDRTYIDAIGFDELQLMAEHDKATPLPEDSQEIAHWIKTLQEADPGGRATDPFSQQTNSTECAVLTPSPRRSTQRSTQSMRMLPSIPEHPMTEITRQRRQTSTPATENPQPSSLTEYPANSSGRASQAVSGQVPQSRKRARESMQTTPQKAKRRASLPSSPQKDRVDGQRKPLGDITQSFSSQDNVSSSPHMQGQDVIQTHATSSVIDLATGEEQEFPLSSSITSFCTAAEGRSSSAPPGPEGMPRSSNQTTIPSSPPPEPKAHVLSPCGYTGSVCALGNCSILLSPCIANFALVSEDLMACHGVTDVFADLNAWKSSPPPSTGSQASVTSSLQQTCSLPDTQQRQRPKKPKKIALVESRRKEPTDAFMRSIEALKLKRRNGKKEWIEVYDWRLLESITTEEQNLYRAEEKNTRQELGTGAHRREIWRRWWVGLV